MKPKKKMFFGALNTSAPVGEISVPLGIVEIPAPSAAIIYSFPAEPKCPRCRVFCNHLTRVLGKVQHRKCDRPHCRIAFDVEGILV